MKRLIRYLLSEHFNHVSTVIGIYISAVFFATFSVVMVVLRPKNSIDKGWTWVVSAVSLVLVRTIAVRFIGTKTWAIY